MRKDEKVIHTQYHEKIFTHKILSPNTSEYVTKSRPNTPGYNLKNFYNAPNVTIYVPYGGRFVQMRYLCGRFAQKCLVKILKFRTKRPHKYNSFLKK